MQDARASSLDSVQQSVALLLNTSADVLTAAASSDPARALALTGTFMATAQEVDATLRAAVAKHTAPQSFMRSPSLAQTRANVTEEAARDESTG